MDRYYHNFSNYTHIEPDLTRVQMPSSEKKNTDNSRVFTKLKLSLIIVLDYPLISAASQKYILAIIFSIKSKSVQIQ